VRILTGAATDPDHPFDAKPGIEYYAGNLTILNSKTVGTGACTGCSRPLGWYVSLITVAGLAGRRDDLTAPLPGGYRWVIWNDPAQIVPARSSSWGQIKSLYR
jgi:hypothetical protein